jgi:hypothetical protein
MSIVPQIIETLPVASAREFTSSSHSVNGREQLTSPRSSPEGNVPKTYTSTALIALTATVAIGCSQPLSPVSPSSLRPSADSSAAFKAGAALSATSAKTFEVRGTLEGTYAGTGVPPFVTVHVEGGGTASHLGRFTFDSTHVVNFIDLTGSGTASLTAANGDQLTGELHGVASPRDAGVFHIVETLTITGGTGRFAGASGEIVIERLSVPGGPANGTTTGSLEGQVTVSH